MQYLFLILSCLFCFNALQAQETKDWQTELKEIDDEIDRAKDLKRRYESAAARYDDDGMRWQFQQDNKQEARRAFERAEQKRQAAQMLQARIDVLNARRAQILQEHPEANALERSS